MGHSHGYKWDEDLITQQIKDVMNVLNIDRMPSNQEVKAVTKSHSLSNKISRSGGFKFWADKLELQIKNSETKFGNIYEIEMLNQLTNKGYNVEKMSVLHPYDLFINSSIKVDVKASKRYYYDTENYYYTFNLEKKYATCDLYICLCINEENSIEKKLIIPSKDLKIQQLSMGAKSKYDKYIDRWDYIKRFDEFYKNLN